MFSCVAFCVAFSSFYDLIGPSPWYDLPSMVSSIRSLHITSYVSLSSVFNGSSIRSSV